MTKIFALNPNVKEGDEKPKELDAITISSTAPQPTFYPVTLPISSIGILLLCFHTTIKRTNAFFSFAKIIHSFIAVIDVKYFTSLIVIMTNQTGNAFQGNFSIQMPFLRMVD